MFSVLQISIMNNKLGQRRFWQCHENEFGRPIQRKENENSTVVVSTTFALYSTIVLRTTTLEFQIDHTVGKNLHGWKNSRSIWQTINFLWRLARYQWPLCQDTFLWLQRHYLYRFSSRVNFFPPCGLFGTREYSLLPNETHDCKKLHCSQSSPRCIQMSIRQISVALIICSRVINNLNGFRTLWEPCKIFYTRVFHLEVESSKNT